MVKTTTRTQSTTHPHPHPSPPPPPHPPILSHPFPHPIPPHPFPPSFSPHPFSPSSPSSPMPFGTSSWLNAPNKSPSKTTTLSSSSSKCPCRSSRLLIWFSKRPSGRFITKTSWPASWTSTSLQPGMFPTPSFPSSHSPPHAHAYMHALCLKIGALSTSPDWSDFVFFSHQLFNCRFSSIGVPLPINLTTSHTVEKKRTFFSPTLHTHVPRTRSTYSLLISSSIISSLFRKERNTFLPHNLLPSPPPSLPPPSLSKKKTSPKFGYWPF